MLNHTEVDLRKRLLEVQIQNGIAIFKPLSVCISEKELKTQLVNRINALYEVVYDIKKDMSIIQKLDFLGNLINVNYLSSLQKNEKIVSTEIAISSHYLLLLTEDSNGFKDIGKIKDSVNILLEGSIFETDSFFVI